MSRVITAGVFQSFQVKMVIFVLTLLHRFTWA